MSVNVSISAPLSKRPFYNSIVEVPEPTIWNGSDKKVTEGNSGKKVEQKGTKCNRTEQNGTERNRTEQSITELNGTE